MQPEKILLNSYHLQQVRIVYLSRLMSIILVVGSAILITYIIINEILSGLIFYMIFIAFTTLAVAAFWLADISSSHLCDIPESIRFLDDMVIFKYSNKCHETQAIKWKHLRSISNVDSYDPQKHGKWKKIFSLPIKFTLYDSEDVIILNIDHEIVLELNRRITANNEIDHSNWRV